MASASHAKGLMLMAKEAIMGFTYNGSTPSAVTYNGNTVNKITFDGTTVWEAIKWYEENVAGAVTKTYNCKAYGYLYAKVNVASTSESGNPSMYFNSNKVAQNAGGGNNWYTLQKSGALNANEGTSTDSIVLKWTPTDISFARPNADMTPAHNWTVRSVYAPGNTPVIKITTASGVVKYYIKIKTADSPVDSF